MKMYCLLALYALFAVTRGQGVGTPVHTIVVDVGNTSSQLKIFQETVVHSRYGPDNRVKLIFSKAFTPSLATYIGNPNGLLAQLDLIMLEARKQVVSAYFEWTSVYVVATSDIRFMPVKDMEWLLDTSREMLSSNLTLNPFRFEPTNVRLLSGEEEAVYSWVSANYLMGNIGKNRFKNETFGVMDMGYGSTQITFIPDEPMYSEKFTILQSKWYELYTQNYLQYGSESILVKIGHQMSHLQHNAALPNPCLLEGDWKNVQMGDGSIITHTGTGDPDQCEKVLAKIVKPSTGDECWPKPCAIGRVYQPQVKEVPFLATVGFVYTPTALGVVDESKILYLDHLKVAARSYCEKTVDQVVAEYEKDRESASHDCLMGIYIPTLLTVAYGFSLDTRAITLAPDFEGEPIDWSHGFVVHLNP